MTPLLKEIQHNKLLWLLAFVPVVFAACSSGLVPVVMIFIATIAASMVTNSGRSTWFVGVLLLMVYTIFAMTLYLLPPQVA